MKEQLQTHLAEAREHPGATKTFGVGDQDQSDLVSTRTFLNILMLFELCFIKLFHSGFQKQQSNGSSSILSSSYRGVTAALAEA